jgi:hypothetical protein
MEIARTGVLPPLDEMYDYDDKWRPVPLPKRDPYMHFSWDEIRNSEHSEKLLEYVNSILYKCGEVSAIDRVFDDSYEIGELVEVKVSRFVFHVGEVISLRNGVLLKLNSGKTQYLLKDQ